MAESVDLLKIKINALPVENPDIKKSGPKMEVFQKGRALKAESKMPVYMPKTIAKMIKPQAIQVRNPFNQPIVCSTIFHLRLSLGKTSLRKVADQARLNGKMNINVQAPQDMGDSRRMVVYKRQK